MFCWFKRKLKAKIRTAKIERKVQKQTCRIKNMINACGERLTVFGKVDIIRPERLSIGKDCRLNDDVYLNARSGITIGDDVTISYGAKLISTGYEIDTWLSAGKKQHFEDKPIEIGNHCWIGAGAIVLPGVRITGEYVVIGAGAIVTKDITESNVLYAGSPAKLIKYLGENEGK